MGSPCGGGAKSLVGVANLVWNTAISQSLDDTGTCERESDFYRKWSRSKVGHYNWVQMIGNHESFGISEVSDGGD